MGIDLMAIYIFFLMINYNSMNIYNNLVNRTVHGAKNTILTIHESTPLKKKKQQINF